MATVKIDFKKKVMYAQYSLEVYIDNQNTVYVANGSSIDIELNEGIHVIRASIPVQGNKMAMVSVQFEIKPGKTYEVAYIAQAMSINAMCKMEVKEISVADHGDKGAIIAKSKGRRNSMMIFSIVLGLVMASVLFWTLYMSGMFSFQRIGGKTIAYVNEPFTITTPYSITKIESIEIISVEDTTINSWEINFEIIGVVEGGDTLNMEIKCYDKDNFFIGTEELRAFSYVADGEKFKVKASIWATEKTVRIEFVKD